MYLLLKLLHIVSVIAFLGNITTGLFWHSHAARTRNPALLEHTMDGIIRSDRWFTVPGVIGILATGIGAAGYAGFSILGTGWILWTLILFGVSGVLFGVFVAPMQKRLRAMARLGRESGSFDLEGYLRLARRWEFWGALALITPLAGLALMVLKPGL